MSALMKRILVIDDEPTVRDICKRILSDSDLMVDTAPDGITGQWMIEAAHYELCLVDMKLPLMNGQEFFAWLKEKHPELAAKTIFMTGDILEGDTQSFLDDLKRPYLLKPFTANELKALVTEVLK